MSRIATACLLSLLLLGSIRSLPAQADQERGARARDIVRLTRERDSLASLWREANALANLVDSLRHAATGSVDTITVGALRIITNPSPLPVRAAAERAWPGIDSMFGDQASRLLDRPIVIHAVDPDTTRPQPSGPWGIAIPWNLNVDDLTALFRTLAPLPEPDTALRRWLAGLLRPETEGERANNQRDVYVLLVTAPYQVAQGCFGGDVDQCRSALALDQGPGTFARRYRRPEERRRIIDSAKWTLGQKGRGKDASQCLSGIDSVCVELMALLPDGYLQPPLGGQAHRSLVHIALRLGGRGAYSRLMADPSLGLAARLVSTSGMPIDSLVARWRSDIMAHRPVPVSLPSYGGVVGLAWLTVFGLCGLRSSRWRRA